MLSMLSNPLVIGIAILFIFLVIITIFSVFKGAVKLICILACITAAIATWLLMQRSGGEFIALVIEQPDPWILQTLSIVAALFVFFVLMRGISWFSQIFSFSQKKTGNKGIVMSILMGLLFIWTLSLGVFYGANLLKIRYYHQLGLAHRAGQPSPEQSYLLKSCETIRQHPFSQMLLRINPFDDPARTNLACIIAYGCSLDQVGYQHFYTQHLATRNIPQPTRLLQLFADSGMRQVVEQKQYVSILESDRLSPILDRQLAVDPQQGMDSNRQSAEEIFAEIL